MTQQSENVNKKIEKICFYPEEIEHFKDLYDDDPALLGEFFFMCLEYLNGQLESSSDNKCVNILFKVHRRKFIKEQLAREKMKRAFATMHKEKRGSL